MDWINITYVLQHIHTILTSNKKKEIQKSTGEDFFLSCKNNQKNIDS